MGWATLLLCALWRVPAGWSRSCLSTSRQAGRAADSEDIVSHSAMEALVDTAERYAWLSVRADVIHKHPSLDAAVALHEGPEAFGWCET